MQVCMVRGLPSSAAVSAHPMYWPEKCSTCRSSVPHAHSWIMSFKDEYTAFKEYARLYPNACTLLVDTYDTLKSGVPNAIRVFRKCAMQASIRKAMASVLIPETWLICPRKQTKMLDEAGFTDAVIAASNDLDEFLINDLKLQGAAITSWGVGDQPHRPLKTVRPSEACISLRQSRMNMENSSRKSRFPKRGKDHESRK